MITEQTSKKNPTTVFKCLDGAWFFWDETFLDACGPFKTEEDADKAIQEYADWLNTGVNPSTTEENSDCIGWLSFVEDKVAFFASTPTYKGKW